MLIFLEPRFLIPLMFAVILDTVTFLACLIIWAIFLHPSVPAAFAGCAISSHYGFWCSAGALIGAAGATAATFVPFVGQALIAGTGTLGAIFGFVVSFCINATFGVILLAFLAYNKMLTWNNFLSLKRLPYIVAKFSPFAFVPVWTFMVIGCALEKVEEELVHKAVPIRTKKQPSEVYA